LSWRGCSARQGVEEAACLQTLVETHVDDLIRRDGARAAILIWSLSS